MFNVIALLFKIKYNFVAFHVPKVNWSELRVPKYVFLRYVYWTFNHWYLNNFGSFGAFFLWHKIPIYPYMLAYVGVINCRNCNCRVRVRVCRNCNCLVLYCCVLLRFVAICCVLLRFVAFCFGLTPVHINMCLNVEEIILIHSSTKTTTVSSNAYGQPPPSTFCSMTEQE